MTTDINMTLAVIERRVEEFDPGEWPVLIAASYSQGAYWANRYGIKHRFIAAVGYPRMLDGLRPSSILYAPGWYLAPDITEMANTLAMIQARMASTIPVHYILEGRP